MAYVRSIFGCKTICTEKNGLRAWTNRLGQTFARAHAHAPARHSLTNSRSQTLTVVNRHATHAIWACKSSGMPFSRRPRASFSRISIRSLLGLPRTSSQVQANYDIFIAFWPAECVHRGEVKSDRTRHQHNHPHAMTNDMDLRTGRSRYRKCTVDPL